MLRSFLSGLADVIHPRVISRASPRPSVTWDYRRGSRGWGHDISYVTRDKGIHLIATGWGPGFPPVSTADSTPDLDLPRLIMPGDYILLTHPDSPAEDVRYQFARITYCLNPRDMFSATLRFAPRTSPQPVSAGPTP